MGAAEGETHFSHLWQEGSQGQVVAPHAGHDAAGRPHACTERSRSIGRLGLTPIQVSGEAAGAVGVHHQPVTPPKARGLLGEGPHHRVGHDVAVQLCRRLNPQALVDVPEVGTDRSSVA